MRYLIRVIETRETLERTDTWSKASSKAVDLHEKRDELAIEVLDTEMNRVVFQVANVHFDWERKRQGEKPEPRKKGAKR